MESSLRLVLFGPPGAGKGTQAQFLKDNFNLEHISSGDLFRYHIRQGTPLGSKASHYINQGLLVPDEITIGIILDKVLGLEPERGFILDGFPRTREQALALEAALREQSRELDRVLFINVPEDELRRRLGNRFICRGCQAPFALDPNDATAVRECNRCGGELYQRPDDRPEAVRQRIEVYQRETSPVLEFYRERGLLTDIPGVGQVECISQRVLSALKLHPNQSTN